MKFNFTDADFNKRVLFRIRISEKQKIISGIVNSLTKRNNYSSQTNFRNINSQIMANFYGTTQYDISKLYNGNRSPIDYFKTETLRGYLYYLTKTVEMWEQKTRENSANKNIEFLNSIINYMGAKTRRELQKINALPEHNESEKPLPKITDTMVKKVYDHLRSSGAQVSPESQKVIDVRIKRLAAKKANDLKKREAKKAKEAKAKETNNETKETKTKKPEKTKEELEKEALLNDEVKKQNNVLKDLKNHKEHLTRQIEYNKMRVNKIKYENKLIDAKNADKETLKEIKLLEQSTAYLERLLINVLNKTNTALENLNNLQFRNNEKKL